MCKILQMFQTNGVNHNMFKKWSENWEGVILVCDESNSNEVKCMVIIIQVVELVSKTVLSFWNISIFIIMIITFYI